MMNKKRISVIILQNGYVLILWKTGETSIIPEVNHGNFVHGGNLLFGLLNADVGLIAILSRGHFSWYATTWATWSSKDKMHKHLVNITTYFTTTGHWWPHCSFGLSDFLQHTAWSTTNSLSRLQEHPSPSPPTICLLCLTTINHQLLGGRLCEIQPFNS